VTRKLSVFLLRAPLQDTAHTVLPEVELEKRYSSLLHTNTTGRITGIVPYRRESTSRLT
jgi:hypothetical protein